MTQNCISALEHINAGYVQYGIDELKKIANTNSLEAQYFMALCYENGIGVEQSQIEAFKLCRKTAERGLPDAMYRMAVYYQNGIAVSADANKSDEWYRRFQQKGGKLLLPDICEIYNEGIKHPENYAMNPNGTAGLNSILAMQNNGNVNSNNNIGSNNQTINHITIVQAAPTPSAVPNSTESQSSSSEVNNTPKSDVDTNLPNSAETNENLFAVIIANENYQEEISVDFAINDGTMFAKYCHCALGIPEDNIHIRKDATLNNIKAEISWMQQVAKAYNGSAKFIVYYAGHGIPDEASGTSYLLPVDGKGSMLETGYSLAEFYKTLGEMPSAGVTIFMDACFSGSKRGDGMLAAARGVAIKAKPQAPKGNMVVFSAAQGDETAYPFKEKEHGMFTYFLLKKLQETYGQVTMGELSTYITEQVSRKSIVTNGKSQTPTVSASAGMGESWKSQRLK